MLANTLGAITESIANSSVTYNSFISAWVSMICFSMQLYFDFSGYSDMAIGMAKIFGFDFKENFNYPYIASSISDFWKRWHISLTSFFREYIYIPLGGKYTNQIRNLLIVWLLTGIWHGAHYNFILWGIYYFSLIMLEKFVIMKYVKIDNLYIKNILCHAITLFLIIIGNTIFYFTNLTKLFDTISIMLLINRSQFSDVYTISLLRENFIFLIISILFTTPYVTELIRDKGYIVNPYFKTIVSAALILLSTFELLTQSYNPFLYFRF